MVGAGQLTRGLEDRSGSVAIIFAFTLFVLCGSIAIGLDYARALGVRTMLQSAVDAAALAAKPNGTENDPDMLKRVEDHFNYNVQKQKFGATELKITSSPIPQGVRVEASADVPTSFGRVLGVSKMPISVKAEAISAKAVFEIALVLDNTYSMVGGPLTELKAAAKTLVENVTTVSETGSVKFALVPFSNYVNVGMSNRTATWMSVPKDYTESGNYCYDTTDWDGCPTTTTTGTCTNDGVPYSCSSSTCSVPGPLRKICYDWSYTHTWNGCAGSRTPVTDTEVSATFGSPIPGILDIGCPSPLTRLTSDVGVINSQIDSMIAQGETYISSGLMWGWRVLSPGEPFKDAAPAKTNPPTRKVMILMTDGANTKSQSDTNHEGWDMTESNKSMETICSKVKADQIEVYTVAFNVTNIDAKEAMKKCATDHNHFFDSKDGAALQAAFTQISGSLVKLSLSR